MLVNDVGESKVTIKKTELLATIKENRAQHKADFDQAQIGFRQAAWKAMETNLNDCIHGHEIKLTIALTVPVQHMKDYDRVIRMLEMSTADEITISEAQFTQYVMDDWDWKAKFVGSTAMYNGGR
jgi:hypothetical protein